MGTSLRLTEGGEERKQASPLTGAGACSRRTFPSLDAHRSREGGWLSPAVPEGHGRLPDRVLAQVEPDHCTGRLLVEIEPVRLEGVDGEVVAVRLAGRRTRAAVARLPEVGHALDCVRWEIRGAPISFRNACGRGGIFDTTQCHQPLPVGASGSYTVIAKRFVPCGTPLHDRGG